MQNHDLCCIIWLIHTVPDIILITVGNYSTMDRSISDEFFFDGKWPFLFYRTLYSATKAPFRFRFCVVAFIIKKIKFQDCALSKLLDLKSKEECSSDRNRLSWKRMHINDLVQSGLVVYMQWNCLVFCQSESCLSAICLFLAPYQLDCSFDWLSKWPLSSNVHLNTIRRVTRERPSVIY